ncbi:hypothetical protein GCM10007979_02670 [Nocardioides albus]|nr:hypothetical protein GCM10007979_02670 [Nocardioides albus]
MKAAASSHFAKPLVEAGERRRMRGGGHEDTAVRHLEWSGAQSSWPVLAQLFEMTLAASPRSQLIGLLTFEGLRTLLG